MQFGQDEEPTGWAGPIAKDLGQGTQGLSSDLADHVNDDGLLPKFEFTQAYLSLYAIMFGLGVVIAVMATMMASVKVAAAKGVDSRIMAQQALIRAARVQRDRRPGTAAARTARQSWPGVWGTGSSTWPPTRWPANCRGWPARWRSAPWPVWSCRAGRR